MKIIIDTVKKTIDEQRTEADIDKKEFDLQVDILSGIGMALAGKVFELCPDNPERLRSVLNDMVSAIIETAQDAMFVMIE